MSLRAEGPWEPGTVTLVDADSDINLHYGGNSLRTPGKKTNLSRAEPGMRVRKRWFPGDLATGEGLIIAVEDNGHVYGPTVHVLWSQEPRQFLPSNGTPRSPDWGSDDESGPLPDDEDD
jgi:hypothetical protein